jgi:hypothetical protein
MGCLSQPNNKNKKKGVVGGFTKKHFTWMIAVLLSNVWRMQPVVKCINQQSFPLPRAIIFFAYTPLRVSKAITSSIPNNQSTSKTRLTRRPIFKRPIPARFGGGAPDNNFYRCEEIVFATNIISDFGMVSQ